MEDSHNIFKLYFFSSHISQVKNYSEGMVQLVKTCGGWIGDEEFAGLLERPHTLKLDSENRLHCSDGPALEYADGFTIYAWHGHQVKQRMITHKQSLSPQMIMGTTNVETRRVLMEIFLETQGADNIIEAFGVTMLDDTPCLGLERQLIKIGEEHYLYCTNGSLEPDGRRRKFLLGIPSEYTYDWETETEIAPPDTAHEASAWTYGIDPDKYIEQVRT